MILSAAELPEDYQHPQVGDTVRFAIGRDKHERLHAFSVEPVWDEEAKDLRVGRRIIIRLHEWDMRQNGGYGLYGPMPVFVLGQFLNSQLRIPEPGDSAGYVDGIQARQLAAARCGYSGRSRHRR